VYASRNSVSHIEKKLQHLADGSPDRWESALNSYCGLLLHGQNYNLKTRLLKGRPSFGKYGIFDYALRHYRFFQTSVS
jgi:hypothetical protein